MPIPININSLITGSTVEWERIEFKKGWNPLVVIHSICAFANDFHNWGGGYIILGIEENDNRPVLPPEGLELNQIDPIQRELHRLCFKLKPNYFPVIEPTDFQGKSIIVIWVPGGNQRPYKAPDTFARKTTYSTYLRINSITRKATREEEQELNTYAQIPFDDRINHHRDLTDLKLPLIQDYLKQIGSALYDPSGNMPFDELCRRMKIAEGPDEYFKPKNIGLLFFNDHPEEIIEGARIDIVEFADKIGKDYTESLFTGPVYQQIKSALNYLKSKIIKETVHKIARQAEALRFYNYPYEAIEEALVNAAYHKSYEERAPVEVRVFQEYIEILSYPGPLPPLNKDNLNDQNLAARRYRNRRIGSFLKELNLTEGRGTGFPNIKNALNNNGSPPPYFETDEDRTYFLTRLSIHPQFIGLDKEVRDKGEVKGTVGGPVRGQVKGTVKGHVRGLVEGEVNGDGRGQVREQVRGQVDKVNLTRLINEDDLHSIQKNKIYQDIITIISRNALTSTLIAVKVGVGKSGFFRRSLSNLVDMKLIEYTIPDKPRSRNQQYRITELGRMVLEYLNIEAQDDE